ncbi:hypothetical protein SEA_TYKE_79 [Mycobacterium phage Tyke]|uniref:Uncharacterized protein n=27 Tax=Bixzunavirus TaxID=680114 RepID=B5LK65_9CAUD|nr:gp76 [Mycobacterium phage Spud]YP_002224772.1 gp74 [Mycobacterium phage Rizal]YP_008060879.1 hypothetical protein M181_gp082 [Mycobacterium phage Gizmo]YP_009012862.1 hypothetical protein DANDELION_83 [Mycobacterium phage Dandelion]YP_009014670.1 hypothetical protein LINSTU_76 [Mycobacterium phage LinStu]YP_009016540.1 hypothetical protein NAPPY_78 [Mycobacterium phage Nappy]YP_009017413.1 hypothetical protein MOMOMIXON_77 [Mycobacterium phage MoMoMixon]YP_009017853.1 hypothetical protein
MSNDDDKVKVWVHLYGGEQDGWRRQIELGDTDPDRAPQMFYVCRIKDESKIAEAGSQTARMALQNKLSQLAYELYDDVAISCAGGRSERELRYRRLASADKVVPNAMG